MISQFGGLAACINEFQSGVGWRLRCMQAQLLLLQADGLGSHMPLFYAPVNQSRWLTGGGPNESCTDGTCVTSSRGPPKKCGVDGHGGLHETFACTG
jgi:hypothetical protein